MPAKSKPQPFDPERVALEACVVAAMEQKTQESIAAVKGLFEARAAKGVDNPLHYLEILIRGVRELGYYPEEMMRFFVAAGANPLASPGICGPRFFQQETGLQLFFSETLAQAEKAGFASRDNNGNSFLHLLAANCPLTLVRLERNLTGHPWLCAQNDSGDTTLHVLWKNFLGQARRQKKAIDAPWSERERERHSELAWDVSGYLMELGADLSMPNSKGKSVAGLMQQAIMAGILPPTRPAALLALLQSEELASTAKPVKARAGRRL